MKFHTYAFTAQGDKTHEPSSLKSDAKKGYYMTVPGFKPETKIFIKNGEDPEKAIKRFKNKRQ